MSINYHQGSIFIYVYFLFLGIIHGDFHDENLILLDNPCVNQTCSSAPMTKYGIIDFGNITRSCLVFDLATCLSFFMMGCYDNEGTDFITWAGYILTGYAQSLPLNQTEMDMLFVSVCASYARELVLCCHDFKAQGGDNSYILTCFKSGWPQLRTLWQKYGQDKVYSLWNQELEASGLPCLA